MSESTVMSSVKATFDLNEKIRVLHVDDDSGFLKLTKQCLELEASVDVEAAVSVDDALTKLENGTFDVIVCDYQMPCKNGLDLLNTLRNNGNKIPFIIFTGKGREEVAIKALNLGADQYLNKTGETETVYRELAHSITELAKIKRIERDIRKTASLLNATLESTVDGILVVDTNCKITSFNKRLLEMWKIPASEVLCNAEPDHVNLARVDGQALDFLTQQVKNRDQFVKTVQDLHSTPELEAHGALEFNDGRYFEFYSMPQRVDGVVVGRVWSFHDVTEHKKTERELSRFSSAVKASLDGIITGDLNGSIADVNDAALRMYGTSDKHDLVGKNVQDILVERDRPRAQQNAIETLQMRKGKTVEYTALTKSGVEVPIEVTTQLLMNEKGEPIGFVDIIRDVTERKKAEEALRESEQRYLRLAAASFEGIGISEEGKITDANDQLAVMLGYARGELVGKSVLDIVAPESRDLVAANLRKGHESPYEYLAMRRDGSVFLAEIRARNIQHKGRTARVVAINDATEHKELEMSLKKSEEKFRGLFNGDPEAVVFIDPTTRIVDINPRFISLFGFSLDEVIGKYLNDVIVPENLVDEGKMLDKKATEGYVYHDTVRMAKDGSLIPVSVSAAPIFVQGQLIGYVGEYKDISLRKNAETKLAMMNEKLRIIGSVTRHDVRNKLSIITMNTYLDKKRLKDHPEMLDSFEQMESACRMIVRIFDFARDYENLGVEELVFTDVEDTIRNAVSLFSDLNGVKIENGCHGLSVLADSLLRQLFYNLIDNSLKYGGKTSQIRIHYEASENQLSLTYEDDGVGIPEDAKAKIFNQGFTTGKGSGYGLYLIKKMMEVYGWKIQETGEPGNGARFIITIPKANKKGKENYKIAVND